MIRDIAQLSVPSVEILADRGGADHLKVVRETTNACWVNSYTFINLPGSRPGPRSGLRPRPDFGLGFKRDAFNRNQLQKLRIYIGDPLIDSFWIAATYNMYLPFLSSEVKCRAAGLDIADRQNAHTQSVTLRGLFTLFCLVGSENELHRQINSFSISHSDMENLGSLRRSSRKNCRILSILDRVGRYLANGTRRQKMDGRINLSKMFTIYGFPNTTKKSAPSSTCYRLAQTSIFRSGIRN